MLTTCFESAKCSSTKDCRCMLRLGLTRARSQPGKGEQLFCARARVTSFGGWGFERRPVSPTHCFPQLRYVRHMVLAMPSVQGEILSECDYAQIGMTELPLPICRT